MKPTYDILFLPSENVSKSNHEFKKMKGQRSSSELILWSKDDTNIISEFIEELKSPKTMSYPDFTKPSIAQCNASEKGLGIVLYQEIDGQMKVISMLPEP